MGRRTGRRSYSQRAIAAIALAAASAGGAAAQDAEASITGSWVFETEVYSFGCHMQGSLVLRPGPTENIYVGELVAEEDCPGIPHYHAEQSVRAIRSGAELKIDAKLTHVTPSPQNYLPDDFQLTVMASDLMLGRLHSADVARVEFRRFDPPIG